MLWPEHDLDSATRRSAMNDGILQQLLAIMARLLALRQTGVPMSPTALDPESGEGHIRRELLALVEQVQAKVVQLEQFRQNAPG
jgi:hypothetical protein